MLKKALAAHVAKGGTFGEIIATYVEIVSQELDTIEAARAAYHEGGQVEIDDIAIVSRGDDPGAYVMAWVWVYDDQRE